MSDPVTMARAARESLSRGLNALQADPNIPAHLRDLGAPIAQAMGALFQIERSAGAQLAAQAPTALGSLQNALAQLQAQPTQHPAVMTAMESVAGALGSVHALTRMQQQIAPPAPPAPQLQPPPQAMPAQPAPQPVQAAPSPQTRPVAPQVAYHQQQQQQPQPAYQAPPVQQQPVVRAPMPSGPDAPVVNAELGAHSPSNFYKGLSGNDIIDHGGLFVSTYKLPRIGTPVRLKVSLPGGYEFEANAVVRWRREAGETAADAPPGFGAQFLEITPEARQLVYRYVRNREPMFHDDL